MYWYRQTQTAISAMLGESLLGLTYPDASDGWKSVQRWGSTSSSPILQTFKVRPRRRTSIWPSMSSRWGVHCVTQWKSDRIGHNFGKKKPKQFHSTSRYGSRFPAAVLKTSSVSMFWLSVDLGQVAFLIGKDTVVMYHVFFKLWLKLTTILSDLSATLGFLIPKS